MSVLEFSKHETEYSSEESTKRNTKKHKDSSESSDSSQKKKKYKPYEEISNEFKNIKPPMFNEEIEKGEESKSWLSRMKKYFHIYNYSNELKEKMAIYNLTGKQFFGWKDIKKVKGIEEHYATWRTFKKHFK